MCGRYTLIHSGNAVKNYFQVDWDLELSPRYNISPGQDILIIRSIKEEPAQYEHIYCRWGLIPSWSKDKINSPINARIETAHEKPFFKRAFKSRRCIIVASGFYEWVSLKQGKQPYYIQRKDKSLIAMAGIWEKNENLTKGPIESCAILTSEASEFLKPIHHRMPVILNQNDIKLWLDPDMYDLGWISRFSKPNRGLSLETYPVGKQVNRASYHEANCIRPLVE